MKQKCLKGDKFEIAFIWGERLTFPQHTHDEYVLSCNIGGNETLTLDGRGHEARESCTTLYNPGQVQGGDGTSCLVSLYLEPHFFETELLSTINANFEKPVVDDSELHRLFSSLISFILVNKQISEVEEMVFNILDIALSRYMILYNDDTFDHDDWRVRKVKELLLDDLSRTPRLNELAELVSLNKLTLLRMFTNATGIPPIAWQRYRRIARARELLNNGMTAAQTACEMGFSDQAHLTRQFSSAYGISPARFAQR
jgi:AraC-like DNA-binding protein